MIAVTNIVAKAWMELLKGNISVPVYPTNALPSEDGNYVLIRKESQSQQPVKSRMWDHPIIIIEIVTKFQKIIDDSVAGAIDNEIRNLWAAPYTSNLPAQSGIDICNVMEDSKTFIDEYDGSHYYYRIITRFRHDIIQLNN